MVELEGIIQINLLATNLMEPVLLIMPLLALACWMRSFTAVCSLTRLLFMSLSHFILS